MWMPAKFLLLTEEDILIPYFFGWLRFFFIKYNGPPNLIFTHVTDFSPINDYPTPHFGKAIE